MLREKKKKNNLSVTSQKIRTWPYDFFDVVVVITIVVIVAAVSAVIDLVVFIAVIYFSLLLLLLFCFILFSKIYVNCHRILVFQQL